GVTQLDLVDGWRRRTVSPDDWGNAGACRERERGYLPRTPRSVLILELDFLNGGRVVVEGDLDERSGDGAGRGGRRGRDRVEERIARDWNFIGVPKHNARAADVDGNPKKGKPRRPVLGFDRRLDERPDVVAAA